MRPECVNCGKASGYDDGVWHPGEFCLYGMFYVCSNMTAENRR